MSTINDRAQRFLESPVAIACSSEMQTALDIITELLASYKKVQSIARTTLDNAPTRWKCGYEAGMKEANKSWEDGWRFGKGQEKLRFDENAMFTEEIMKLEEEIDRLKSK